MMDEQIDRTKAPATSDEALVAAAQQGDSVAFGELYEKHFDAIYQYLYYRVQTIEDAEDLTTTVFLRAWKNIKKFKWRGPPFIAWLYRIAHNLVIDFRRTSKTLTVDIDDHNNLLADMRVPERPSSAEMQMHSVLQALDQLNTKHQEVLTLRFLVGMSHREVAEILDRNEGTARVLQYRALQALRKKLEEIEQPSP